MIEVNSFAQLRTTAPTTSGDFASLKRYNDGDSKYRGGGDFVGFLTTTLPADDGGTTAVGTNFYWKRVVNDPADLNVFHFGAKGDGYADDTAAVQRMVNWASTYNGNCFDLGVRFPGGKFLVKPIDISATQQSFFYLYGDDNPHGGMPRTVIISDKTSAPVFKVQARRCVIKGIWWNGQASADTTTNTGVITAAMTSNQQPFFENTITQGDSALIDGFRAQNTGGTVIKLQDTFDTRFNQIYALYTYSRVFDIGWSQSDGQNWDHSTAIELSNANFQNGFADATLYMPRVSQGLLRNVWIEHSRYPGDLTNGQWVVDALSIESCDNPLNMNNCRTQMRQLNLQSGGNVSLDSSGTRWLSSYEYGWRRDENYGTVMTGTMKAGWYSGYKITNTSTSDKWYRLGNFYMPKDNQQWVIEMIGRASNDTLSTPAGSPVTSIASCRTYLNLSRCSTAIYGDIYHHGSPAVIDVKFNRIAISYAEVWVKLRANSGDTMFNLKTTGPTRFESGSWSLFTPDLSETVDTSKIGTSVPNARCSLHNGLAGVGANEKGVLTVATAAAATPASTTPAGYITVNINGTDRKVAWFN